MDITLKQQYKSLKPFSVNDLPNFMVLTGPNGSGKSQFIQLIYNSIVKQSRESVFAEITNFDCNPNEVTFIQNNLNLFRSSQIGFGGYQQRMNQAYRTFINTSKSDISSADDIKKKNYFENLGILKLIGKNNFKEVTFTEFQDYFVKKNENQNLLEVISDIFYDYRLSEIDLIIRDFSKEDIRRELGIEPWETLRSIIRNSKLPYEINDPSKNSVKDFFTLMITHKDLKCNVEFTDLSSGEKVLMSLAIYLFKYQFYSLKPKLLILDEPDAHLHPEMAYALISILYDFFVKDLNINVILTTHSPSTIAMVNDDSIFRVSNKDNEFLKKISKDDALKLLTSFIPTLNIDYKNHKQVFVESPTDRNYYQAVFEKISIENNVESKLYFISNGYGKGSCTQVIETVESIRKSQNESFFGIIDWDKTNNDVNYVKVHGKNNRYSLENYVYDPVYIIILLLQLEAHNIHSELGISKNYNQFSLYNDIDLVNKAIEWFFNKIYDKYPAYKSEHGSKRRTYYFNDLELEFPLWYLEEQGHSVEEKLKIIFPAFGSFRNEGQLQSELTKIIIKSYPLIPLDTVKVFEEILDVKFAK